MTSLEPVARPREETSDALIASRASWGGFWIAAGFTLLDAWQGWPVSTAVAGFTTLLMGASVIATRWGRIDVSRVIAVVAVLIVVVFGSLITGGLESPVLLWSLLLPALVTDVDARRARVSGGVVIVLVATIGAIHLAGLGPASELPATWQPVFYAFTVIALIAIWTKVQADRMEARWVVQNARVAAQRELEAARARADAANAAKSQFLAHMSHEIRTPLNGILGLADLLRSSPLQGEQVERVAMLQEAGRSLLSVINDVLDFSRIESGVVALSPSVFDPTRLAYDTFAFFRPLAGDLTLRVEQGPGVPAWVRADAGRVRQVLTNLVGNAVKFTAEGGVTCHVGWDPDHARLIYAVQDTGIGISDEDRSRLFEPFTQLDPTSTRHQGGTGLGLVISRRLARILGGDLEVSSTAGVGSVFTFGVPAPAAEVPTDEVQPASPLARSPTDSVPVRVLVAEDNAISLVVARAMLEQMGCAVDGVVNGAQAVEAVCASSYDLILMDCMMPELDGAEATRRIRAREGQGHHVPIVALTANAQLEQRDEALAAGMDGVLTKPIDVAALRRVVEGVRTAV